MNGYCKRSLLAFLLAFLFSFSAEKVYAGCNGIVKCYRQDSYSCSSVQLWGAGCIGTTQTACLDYQDQKLDECRKGGDCESGGCYWTAPPPTATPIPPPTCNTGSWINSSCGGNGCGATQMYQTRSVSPAGCASSSRCIDGAPWNCGNTQPSCTVSSAVLTPSSATVGLGSSVTLTLTVSDSPAGCTSDGNFVKSNTNVTITSTNPDPNTPFSAIVRCDRAGTSTITGQALVSGTVRASDSTTITCVDMTCTTGPWVNASCGTANGCLATQRQQTRTVSPAGCDNSTQCIADANCGPTPTLPASCTATAWVNGACGGGACASSQREQTRTVNPAGCSKTSQCIADASCSTCTSTAWVNGVCGGGSCGVTQRQQTRTVSPAGCTTTSQCINDASCGPTPTDDIACTFSAWVNSSCGGGSCDDTQRLQTRTVSPVGCSTNTQRCIADNLCNNAVSPTPSVTPRPTATATPTPPACIAPVPRDPPVVECGSPAKVTWEWNDVGGVNQYNLVIQQYSGGVWSTVSDYGWQAASTYSCEGDGAGLCAKVDYRNPGVYRSRIRARNLNSALCSASAFSTSNQVSLFDCTEISIPPVAINGAPASYTIPVSTTNMPPGGTITFTIDAPIATFNPPADSSFAYSTIATSVTTGETIYRVSTVDLYGNPVTAQNTFKVINPMPWCQAKEGDIMAKNNIFCNIPAPCGADPTCKPFVITNDAGEAPGLAAAGAGFSAGTGEASASPYNFKITGDQYSGKDYNYTYLNNKVSGSNFSTVGSSVGSAAALTSGTPYDGFIWKRSSGNLTISGNIDLGDSRVVVFVPGNLNINGNINLNDGRGFFMAVVAGAVVVSDTVHDSGAFRTDPDGLPEVEGIYYSEGDFVSLSAGDDADQQLHVRGVVAAGDFLLNRDLPDNSTIASEYFEYGADQVLRLPAMLSRKQVIWKEVAP